MESLRGLRIILLKCIETKFKMASKLYSYCVSDNPTLFAHHWEDCGLQYQQLYTGGRQSSPLNFANVAKRGLFINSVFFITVQ